MKILVSFENRVRPDSTGVYIVNAFRQLGHEVDHVLPEKIMSVSGGYDLYVKCDDGQRQTAWNAALHPSHYIAIDTHIESDWRIQLAREGKFDTVSVVHSDGLKLNWGRDDIYWLPVGCDPTVHFVGLRDKKYDGCFIGNFHNNLAGPRIEMLDTFFKSVGNFFFGARTFTDMAEKYAESKLVFNRSIHGDLNMRFYEGLCSGSCVVTDNVPDLEKLGFVDGVHFAGYNDKESLERVVKELLADDAKREGIAACGKEISKLHTYAERMKVLLEKSKGGVYGYAGCR